MCLTRKFNIGFSLILFCIILSACGPSPEELAVTSAAETAAAASSTPIPPTVTPTLTPTPTPTPVPYDLSVLITGEDELPIKGAIVGIEEVWEKDGQITDDIGQAFLYDLPGETVNITINAQGFFSSNISATIQRGENQLSVTLERDPFGVFPADACLPGEKLLYIEDFQDGEAQGWSAIEFWTQGWELGPNPEVPEDIVAMNNLGSETVRASLDNLKFGNAVLRVSFRYNGDRQTLFSWRESYVPFEMIGGISEFSRYMALFGPVGFWASRQTHPIDQIHIINFNHLTTRDEWHSIEISTFEDIYDVWKDGIRMVRYKDPQPIPDGILTFEIDNAYGGEDSAVYFNDIVICELTEPFIPMPTPEP